MTQAVPELYATTLHIRDHCLCLHAQRAARALSRRFDEAMRPVGITSGQFSILNSLNRPEPPTIGAVASLLGMDRSTVTANLKPLQRMGALTMTIDARDRRGRRAGLSARGRELLAEATPIWRRVHAEIEVDLDGGGDALRGGLNRLS
ncbi:MAG: MarR family winged helix-turn-helix transcriptional regulator [Alphaproteobacteria bacterium]|nr:MarR family winged helix-turn-helix transcriptional regulator [Alphaproteobacteria bacterium]MBU2377800.1 MarR family winged helix-turn-helix transcriptional regulator [Alphaproteobacteria bacterium]